MPKLIERIVVLVKAAPTWLAGAAVVVTALDAEIVDLLPESWQGDASELVVKLLAWIAAATAIVRRVTPVLPVERGLLPPGS